MYVTKNRKQIKSVIRKKSELNVKELLKVSGYPNLNIMEKCKY